MDDVAAASALTELEKGEQGDLENVTAAEAGPVGRLVGLEHTLAAGRGPTYGAHTAPDVQPSEALAAALAAEAAMRQEMETIVAAMASAHVAAVAEIESTHTETMRLERLAHVEALKNERAALEMSLSLVHAERLHETCVNHRSDMAKLRQQQRLQAEQLQAAAEEETEEVNVLHAQAMSTAELRFTDGCLRLRLELEERHQRQVAALEARAVAAEAALQAVSVRNSEIA
jgi:hypothetical protein